MDFSQLDAGKLRIEPKKFQFQNILYDLESIVKLSASEKGLTIYFQPLSENPLLYGDDDRILQVLVNLISNAVKFTPKGSVKIYTELTKNENDYTISIKIIDTGIGIPSNYLSILFHPWTQLEKGNAKNYEGSGLGLYICKKLIELMGGKIDITSSEGIGTDALIILNLPFISENNKRTNFQTDNKTKTIKKSLALCKKNILLAEDNLINQKLVRRFLCKMGDVNYDIVSNGKDAFEMYSKNKYDLIILDQSMPGMDGNTVCSEIRKIDNDIKIVSMSANTILSENEASVIKGANGHISKPFSYQEFSDFIMGWLSL